MTLDILIIDDKTQKIDALRNVITPLFAEGEVVIDEAQTIAEGRDKMRECTFDLLILDMVVPELEGEEASHTAGADFLNELYETDNLQMPLQIIGLTEYEAEFNAQQAEFRDRLWYLLFYSQRDLRWKKMLRAKVLQLDKMKRGFVESMQNRNKFDVGIICAISEEFEQLQRAFAPCEWTDCRLPGLPYSFRTTILPTSDMRDLRIIAACAEHPGVCATAVLATSLYTVARVDAIFMTGITAGLPDRDVLLDDVVVADSVLDYAQGKLQEFPESRGEIRLLHEISQMSAHHGLISRVSSFCREQGIIDDINIDVRDKNLKEDRTNITPHVTKTVCGPFVMESQSLVDSLKSDDRKLQALDMEGFGLYFASYVLDRPSLWMKSVCDFGIYPKDKTRHKACAYISARFLYEFLREKY